MNTQSDVPNRGGGGSPPSTGPTPDVLPKANLLQTEASSQTGVSTQNAPNAKEQASPPPSPDERQWYTMRCTYGKEKTLYEHFLKLGITAYYPIEKIRKDRKSKSAPTERSFIPNIFFAYSTYDELKPIVESNDKNTKYLRFYFNKHHDGSSEPLIVPTKQMRSLMIICGAEEKDIILQTAPIQKFITGEKVVITEGDFAGVIGTVGRFKGQQRVGVVINGLLTAITAYIPNAFLKKLDNNI